MSTAKELTFEIWRTSEKRCYHLISAAGAAIGLSKSIATISPEVGMQPHKIKHEFSSVVDQKITTLGEKQRIVIFAQLSLLIAGAFLLVSSKIDVLEIKLGTLT